MHVLIIPSERFVPEGQPLEGIFPYHQAAILAEAGYKVGALSIDLSFSVPMIVKGVLYKLIGKTTGNKSDQHSIRSLLKLGFEKVFVASKFVQRETINGVSVYRMDGLYYRKPVAEKNHVSWIKAGLTCFEVYQNEAGRPAVLHAHEALYAGMLARRISEKYGIPYVITEHSSFYAMGNPEKDQLRRVKLAYSSASRLYAVSQSLASFLNGKFGLQNFHYLPNVLDVELEVASFDKRRESNGTFRFLHIALFKPVKDQLMLLKAFKKAAEKATDIKLVIGGGGALEAELKAFVVQNSLQNKVRFLGILSRAEVITELNKCDCFVLSSKYETFGVVIIEALLFGRPVISTAVGIAADIIDADMGFVVPVGDEKAMADAMLKMAANKNTYDAERIRAFAINEFGKDAFVKRMNKIYSEVV